MAAHIFIPPVAEHIEFGLIHPQNDTVGTNPVHARAGVFEDIREIPFTPSERLFRFLTFSDVHQHVEGTDTFSGGVPQGLGVRKHMASCAVRTFDDDLLPSDCTTFAQGDRHWTLIQWQRSAVRAIDLPGSTPQVFAGFRLLSPQIDRRLIVQRHITLLVAGIDGSGKGLNQIPITSFAFSQRLFLSHPLGYIPQNNYCVERAFLDPEFRDGNVDGKFFTVGTRTTKSTQPTPGEFRDVREIGSPDMAPVHRPKPPWDEPLNRYSDCIRCRPPEHLFSGVVEAGHPLGLVDRDDGIDR